jgi:hypothetical protein
VFPFDFSGYDHDWRWLFRTVTAVAVVATAIGVLSGVARLAGALRRSMVAGSQARSDP